MGQAGMLDTARFTNFVAETLAVPVGSVRTLTLGSHGDTMVPVPSRCTVDGKPLSDLLPADKIEELVVAHPQRRRRGRGAAQDRLGVLRAVGRGGAHGQGGRGGLRGGRCRSARGSTASTASTASTSASRPRSAAAGVRRVVEGDLTETELAGAQGGRRGRARQAGGRPEPLRLRRPGRGYGWSLRGLLSLRRSRLVGTVSARVEKRPGAHDRVGRGRARDRVDEGHLVRRPLGAAMADQIGNGGGSVSAGVAAPAAGDGHMRPEAVVRRVQPALEVPREVGEPLGALDAEPEDRPERAGSGRPGRLPPPEAPRATGRGSRWCAERRPARGTPA